MEEVEREVRGERPKESREICGEHIRGGTHSHVKSHVTALTRPGDKLLSLSCLLTYVEPLLSPTWNFIESIILPTLAIWEPTWRR
jgi:hypothetical protein